MQQIVTSVIAARPLARLLLLVLFGAVLTLPVAGLIATLLSTGPR
jgi:hypothetical protein